MGFRQLLGPRPNSQAHPSRTPFPTCSMTTWPNLYFLQHPPTRIYPERPYFQQACLKAFSKPDASHHSPRLPFSSLHSNPPPPAVNPTPIPPANLVSQTFFWDDGRISKCQFSGAATAWTAPVAGALEPSRFSYAKKSKTLRRTTPEVDCVAPSQKYHYQNDFVPPPRHPIPP